MIKNNYEFSCENTAVNLSGKALGIAPKLEGTLANMANDLRYISSEGIYYANNPALLAQGGINTVTNYLNKTTKMMAETPIKVAVTNGIAAATVKAGFEGYDYYSGKSLTKENLLNSGKEVTLSGGLGLATSGMPFSAALVTGLATDKIKDGNVNLTKNVSSGLVGEGLGYFYPLNPFIRETGTQLYEYWHTKNSKQGDKNE